MAAAIPRANAFRYFFPLAKGERILRLVIAFRNKQRGQPAFSVQLRVENTSQQNELLSRVLEEEKKKKRRKRKMNYSIEALAIFVQ